MSLCAVLEKKAHSSQWKADPICKGNASAIDIDDISSAVLIILVSFSFFLRQTHFQPRHIHNPPHASHDTI